LEGRSMHDYTSQSLQSLPGAISMRLVSRAYGQLLYVDALLACRGFPAVRRKLSQFSVRRNNARKWSDAEICRAVDLACVFYFKQVLCLQRSAVATILLRKAQFPAEMVVGAQPCPFRAHAWVEVAGRVVNDKPYTPELYEVLDRC